MADQRRLRRLESLILQTVAPLVSNQLKDPRLEFVTVTRIRLSADLGVARINWSTLGEQADRNKADRALQDAYGRIHKAVAAAMQTRTLPRLEFHFDEAMQRAFRVHGILDELARERAEKEAAAAAETGDAEADPTDTVE